MYLKTSLGRRDVRVERVNWLGFVLLSSWKIKVLVNVDAGQVSEVQQMPLLTVFRDTVTVNKQHVHRTSQRGYLLSATEAWALFKLLDKPRLNVYTHKDVRAGLL